MSKSLISRTYVAESPLNGWGVFAATAIKRGQLVEVNPVLPRDDPQQPDGYAKHEFAVDGGCGLCLGNISLANHAEQYNATSELDVDAMLMRLVARRDIEQGEEITITYGPRWKEWLGE